MSVPLVDYAKLPAAERDELAAALGPLTTLERALNWGRARHPPSDIEEILTQDEYTHDVVMRVSASRYLVFDTT